jgi:23S rRNA (pseudouridine1915-N3)-methyltransferase
MPKDYQLNLKEIPVIKRTKSIPIERTIQIEGQKLLAAIPENNLAIVLDEHGQEWTTYELARKISAWHREQQDISLLIGGPDGLAKSLLKNSSITWSLSKLTLPHQLVRVMVAEQIYRSWSIISNHPYHRN